MNTAKEILFKMPNTETDQDPDTVTEIYPEIYPETRSTEYNPETPQIHKHPRSRSRSSAQATETTLTNPDMNTAKKMPNTEDPETATEIYPEIYPETRSTAYAALPTTTSSQRVIKETQMQSIQKQQKLSSFEETLVEMFNLPENIKELVPVSSPIPDLDLQTELALPLEENSFLDYLNDSNII